MIARRLIFFGVLVLFGVYKVTEGQLFGQPCCNTQCCCSVCGSCDAAPVFGSGSWPASAGLGPVSNQCNCQNLTYTCYLYQNVPSPVGPSYGLPPAPYIPSQPAPYVQQPPQVPQYVPPPYVEPPLRPVSPCNKPSCSIMPIPRPQPCNCAIQPCATPCINIDVPITIDSDILDDGISFWEYDADFLKTPQGIIVFVVVILLAILVLCLLIALIAGCIKTFCCCCKKKDTVVESSTSNTQVYNYQTDEYPSKYDEQYYGTRRMRPTY
uniref:Uncharacterized protein n=1 Tax=Panagrellus redivivus TaxID=6233 RepID=A0A7E4V3I7_PANRE